MGFVQVINHEAEGSIASNDLVFQHQYQMRAAAHFIDGHLGSVKYGTHANCAQEPGRVVHAVRLQNDVRYSHRGALIGLTHVLDAQRPRSATPSSGASEGTAREAGVRWSAL